MKLGMIGLGRMGFNMTLRLLQGGHEVVVYDRDLSKGEELKKHGAIPAQSLEEAVKLLSKQKIVWVMVPSGAPVDGVLEEVSPMLQKGDILIEGGNSNYKDSLRRSEQAKSRGLHYLDAGTSGGIWGLEIGYCLMVGGEKEAFTVAEPIFKTLAPKDGYAHVGPNGAGHFSKMIHNGIEYGMLQAYGEGFQVLEQSQFPFDLNQLASLWGKGSVIRSWLLELAQSALAKDPHLKDIRGYVDDSGEGRWTVKEAIDLDVPAPVLTLALMERFHSRQENAFSARLIAALRNEFGGHAVKKDS